MKSLEFFALIKILFFDREPDLERVQRMGLLAVKLGQIMALRPDFLGVERCRILSRLYSNAESLPPEDAASLIRSSALPEFLAAFRHFEISPFAAASIGQVHRAELLDGSPVAVKLVKRDFAASFAHDARVLRNLFEWAIRLYPRLRGVANPVSLLHQIERMTLRELDMRNEVSGGQLLESLRQQHAQRYDLSHMRLPRLYPELSNDRVLVSEFLAAPSLDQLLSRGQLSYQRLLELFNLHGYFLFSVGTFHGDIHPGNILLDGDSFVFIDTGYIATAPRRLRTNLFYFFAALSADDLPESAAALNRIADTPLAGRDFARFRERFFSLYANFKGSTVSQISLTRQMMLTIRLAVQSGMVFDEAIFDVIKSLMFLDGMVLRANPNAVLLHDMRPLLDSFLPYLEPLEGSTL